MKLRSRTCARAVGLAVGLACPALSALGADSVATVRFNNQSWGNPANWEQSNAALNNTVPNNTRENDYDVVVSRTVDLDLDVTVEKGLLDGGQISDAAASPNTLRFNDLFTFRNGFLQPNTTAAGGIAFDNATGNPFIERGTLHNLAMANWTAGTVSPIAGGGIENAPGAMFYVRASAANLSYFSNDLTGFLNNQATVTKLGAFRWDVRANFTNATAGVLDVDEGEVRLLSGGVSRGTFDLAAGTKVAITGGTYVLRDAARVTGPGWLEVGQFGNLRVGETAQPAGEVSIDNLLLNRGGLFLRGASRLNLLVDAEFDRAQVAGEGDEKIHVKPGARLRIKLADGPMAISDLTLNNRGETTVVGGGSNALTLQNGAWLRNSSVGLLNLDAPGAFASTTAVPGAIVNRGTMNVRATPQGGGVSVLNVDIENHGEFHVGPNTQMQIFDAALRQLDGVMDVERDASVVLINVIVALGGGLLRGEGTVQSDTTVQVGTTPGSTLRVSPGQTPGKLTFQADVTMGDNAELLVELGGRVQATQYDLLDVNGTAALDGDLLIDLIDGFELGILPADLFTVMTADAPLTGAFDNVASGGRVTGVDGFATFQVNYGAGSPFDPNSVVLSNVQFIPEPGAGIVTCAAALRLTRRRKS